MEYPDEILDILCDKPKEVEVEFTCVSCGNPASSDFCDFCLNEE